MKAISRRGVCVGGGIEGCVCVLYKEVLKEGDRVSGPLCNRYSSGHHQIMGELLYLQIFLARTAQIAITTYLPPQDIINVCIV